MDEYGGCSLIKNIASMAEKGLYRLFKLFIDADESLLRLSTRRSILGDDNNCTQKELYSGTDQYEDFNFNIYLVGILAQGSAHRPYGNLVKEGLNMYHWHFRCWYEHDVSKENSWLSHMKDLLESAKESNMAHSVTRLVEYKVALLEDDESLEGRLKILEYCCRGQRIATSASSRSYPSSSVRRA